MTGIDKTGLPVLSLVLFTPLIGVAVLLLVPGTNHRLIRWVALLAAVASLAFSLLLTTYDPAANSQVEDSASARHEPKAGSRVTVEGSHHKEADVLFDVPAGRLVLIVKDLAGVPERRLVFEA